MNITLFGYPKTGKTTLFNLLTGAGIQTSAFEEGKKEPVFRSCPVPDSRLDKIWSLYQDKKKIPATIDFTDLVGISLGEIKNSAYLSHLRRADGLVHVVRGFTDSQIPHPKGKINPKEDILSMEEELILADMISIETRLEKLKKELQRKKDSEGEREKELLEKLHSALEEGKGIRELSLSSSEEKLLRSFQLLSQKPILHVINLDEQDIPSIEQANKFLPDKKEKVEVLAFCGKIESEIMELDEEEKQEFMKEYGLKELSITRFLKSSYALLGVITFYTVGKEEVKAWTIPYNATAVQAAGTIHSDMEKGFIKAEVISWEELLQHGSFQKAREKGAVRLEGKKYIVQDGDVIYFRFSP